MVARRDGLPFWPSNNSPNLARSKTCLCATRQCLRVYSRGATSFRRVTTAGQSGRSEVTRAASTAIVGRLRKQILKGRKSVGRLQVGSEKDRTATQVSGCTGLVSIL